jgi:hypothetical protein
MVILASENFLYHFSCDFKYILVLFNFNKGGNTKMICN